MWHQTRYRAVQPLSRYVLAAAMLAVAGCGGYGDISPDTYQYAKALYAITNRQVADKLDQVSQQIDLAQRQKRLADHEAQWLDEIIDDARAGQWKAANRAARQMMEDQVKP